MNEKDELHVDEQVMTGVDYVVSRGEYWKVEYHAFEDKQYLKRVDGIPDEYHERWEDDGE